MHPELTYVRAKTGPLEAPVVLAEALVERVLGAEGDVKILDRFPGAALDGVRYEPPFPYIPAKEYGERGHTVLLADFVTADDGTGLVHTAIAFGEDDFRLGERYGLNVVNPVRLDGTYDERIGKYAGRFVKDADQDLIEDLRSRGKLLRAEDYEHSYPYCWRSGDPLLYYAKPAWYIATSQKRDELLAANESVNWHPEHIKHGRFGNWLENNVDWALSRERYWGTPLPIWRCPEGHIHCIGSLDELEELSGVALEDPHRPVRRRRRRSRARECRRRMKRVPEVIDVWFDSGAMPFAQHHAPFENEEQFRERLPRRLHLRGARPDARLVLLAARGRRRCCSTSRTYKNVVCLGLILDEEGQKMSKSKGNIVVPWDVLDRFGADAFRWYFFTSKQPWDGYRFSMERGRRGRPPLPAPAVEHVRLLRPVRERQRRPARRRAGEPTDARPRGSSRAWPRRPSVTERLEAYDATAAGRAIAEFVDDLSNWYVRRSRRRFWDGDPARVRDAARLPA